MLSSTWVRQTDTTECKMALALSGISIITFIVGVSMYSHYDQQMVKKAKLIAFHITFIPVYTFIFILIVLACIAFFSRN